MRWWVQNMMESISTSSSRKNLEIQNWAKLWLMLLSLPSTSSSFSPPSSPATRFLHLSISILSTYERKIHLVVVLLNNFFFYNLSRSRTNLIWMQRSPTYAFRHPRRLLIFLLITSKLRMSPLVKLGNLTLLMVALLLIIQYVYYFL